MVTTKIQITPHLAEYCIGKWGTAPNEPVCFPDSTELYFLIHDLTQKRPRGCHTDCGNLSIVIPNRSKSNDELIRKNPDTYNYLSDRSVKKIQDRIECMMLRELHELLDHNKHRKGICFIDTVYHFKCKYCIESITDEAFIKDHQRWRRKNNNLEKREYIRKTV
ncbi:hypothetical protein D0T49_01975 [Paludibacter sp. 221]|nr:hypothetical protein [Paludibacter sp. 221]